MARTIDARPTPMSISTRVKARPVCRRESPLDSRASVLECASPLALFLRVPDNSETPSFNASPRHFESGTGLPHSKTLSRSPGPSCSRQVLECASPVALFLRVPDNSETPSFNASPRHFESGTGLPRSKTPSRSPGPSCSRPVLQCPAPAALFSRVPDNSETPSFNASPRRFESGTGLPHSKTLSRSPGPSCFRQVLECASPLALFIRTPKARVSGGRPSTFCAEFQSATGLAHSKTWRKFGRFMERSFVHVVLHAVAGDERLHLPGAD